MTQTVPDISPLMPMHQDPLLVSSMDHVPFQFIDFQSVLDQGWLTSHCFFGIQCAPTMQRLHNCMHPSWWRHDMTRATVNAERRLSCLNQYVASNQIVNTSELSAPNSSIYVSVPPQRTHNAIITSLWRQSDVVLTSSWRYYCVVCPLGPHQQMEVNVPIS